MTDVFDTGAIAAVADERSTLEAFLDYYRSAVAAKVRGISEDDARRRLVPSRTTMAGLIKHLTRVEMSWFQHRLGQVPAEDLPLVAAVMEDEESDFFVGPDESVERLLARYAEQCARSRATAAKFDLDEVVPHPVLGEAPCAGSSPT